MTAYSFPPFIAAIANLCIGLFVIGFAPKRRINQLYLSLSTCGALWNLGVFFLFLKHDPESALFWARLLQNGVILIPPLFLHLIYHLLGKRNSKLLAGTYGIAIAFVSLNLSGHLINDIKTVTYPNGVQHSYGQGGALYASFMLFLLSSMFIIVKKLLWAIRTTTGIKHEQFKYLLLALGITLAGGLNDMMPIVSVQNYPMFNVPVYPFGSIAIIGWAFIIAYAILKHRLMDIDVVIKKSVTYSALLLLLLVPCYVMLIAGQSVFFGRVDRGFSALFLTLLTVATFVFPRLKTRTERTIEQVLFKGKYDYRDTLARFSQDLVTIINLDTLLNRTLTVLADTMEITRAWAWLYHRGSDRFQLQASTSEDHMLTGEVFLPMSHVLLEELAVRPRVLVTEELERYEINPNAVALGAALRELDCEACVPLSAKGRLIGVIMLGRKTEGGIYSEEDLKLLATLGNEAAIAVENARLYEDLKQQQTQFLRAQRLATVGHLAAGLAHEIRNPLVAVKTFLQLLPERLDDEEFRTSFLEMTSSEVERITHLLNQLLEFARPSDPVYRPEDLVKTADQMATLAKNEAFKRGISLTTRYDAGVPLVTMDAKQMKQVVQNLLNNAIQATPEGGTVHLDIRRHRGPEGEAQVQLEVSDTGRGIAEEDLDKLFTPFYTTRDAGTGLGLAMAHRIIIDHHGTISVKSQLDSGTQFTITLPIEPALGPADTESLELPDPGESPRE